MLMKLERDRLASRIASLEAQLVQVEGAHPAQVKADKQQKRCLPSRLRGATLPPDSRENPYLAHDYAAVAVERWALSKTIDAHSASVAAVAIHPAKPIVATAADDGLWKMWSLSTADLVMSGDGHKVKAACILAISSALIHTTLKLGARSACVHRYFVWIE